MRRASLLLYLSLSTAATASPGPSETVGPLPGYIGLHAKTRGFSLGKPMRPTPTPDGKQVLFLRATAASSELRLFALDVATGQSRELLTPAQLLQGAEERLSVEEKARRERMRQSMRGFTSFELSKDGSFLLIPLSGKLYTYQLRSGDSSELAPVTEPIDRSSEPIVDPHLSPNGKSVAYVRGRDLYVMDLATRREKRLMNSTSPVVSYGSAEFIAQEELHRFSGFFWSPDSQHIAFTEVNNQPVETLYVGDVLRPEQPPQPLRYPRAGTDNAEVRLGIIAVTGGNPLWVSWARDRLTYLATVVWREGGPLMLTLLTRSQRDLELLAVDPKTGQTQKLLSEHSDAWINIDQDVPRPLRDGSGFLWSTERQGMRELELRDYTGGLRRIVVDKSQGFRKLLHVDDQAGFISYAASVEPTCQDIYRVSLASGSPLKLTTSGGYHVASFGQHPGVYILSSFSTTQLGKTVVMRIPDSSQAATVDQVVGELPSIATPPPFVPNLEIAQVGPQAYRSLLVRPRNFQPGKKYPVLVHVYGGPHHNQVLAIAGMYMLDQWLADHGFIVFMTDGRGTPGRGTPWEHAIAGNFAEIPLDDQVAALQAAGERFPEMDLSRVGVFGWSFGGYMAALAVLRRPDVFHVGVAGAPVVDWRDYDTCYTERYISTPQENVEGYDRSSLLTYAPQLKRPLVLIHGTADDNVLFFHSLKLSQALFRAGKPHELVPLPGLTHMVPDPIVTERLWGRIVGAFAAVLHPELAHLAVKPGAGAPPSPEPILAAPAGSAPKKPAPRR
ncbi:MAG: DPP IV N-terminal domain-containing protein [Myxococcales bacterium]|nr:DPP IV N-terminal domain-containing protein [Myxococcales bacterium]